MNYKEYQKLIQKIAWNYKRKNPNLDIEDLIGEGNLIYVKVIKTFNKNFNVKFSSYLYQALNRGINNYVKKENNFYRKTEEIKDTITKAEDFTFFEITEESKKVINIIKDFPLELRSKKNKVTQQVLSTFLHNVYGYKFKEIKNIFTEIKGCLV